MATTHGSDKWCLYGGGAEVQPLPNSRYRVTIRCQEHSLSEDWYYANKANIFKSFGDAYDLPLEDGAGAGSSWTPADGEEYPDLTLIDTEYGYIPSKDTPLLSFVYETLTGSWANEDNDLNSSSINGLRVLEQTQVATSNTPLPYDEDDIGVVTNSDGGKTLYLVGIDDKSTERMGRVILQWAEKGILSVQTPKVGGQQQVVVQALGMTSTEVDAALSEVAANHVLIDEGKGDYEGFQSTDFTFQIDDFEVLSATSNGLEQLERTELSASNFTRQTVGTETYNGLKLISEDIDNGNSIKLRETQWTEDGILSISSRNMSEGVQAVETVFLADEGATVGPVYARETRDYEGLKTIRVTTLQDKDGNSIVDGGENLVHRYERKVPFTYPGVVGLNHDIIEAIGTDPNLLNFQLDPPVEAKVDATVSVIFQTSGSIVAADEVYDDGTGAADSYWNPTDWAKTYLSGIGWSFSPFVETQGLRGYRVDSDVSGVTKNLAPVGSITLTSNGVTIIRNTGNNYLEANSSATVPVLAEINGTQDSNGQKYIVNGRRIYGSTPFTMRASGGPVDPSGTKYVLDIDIRPAFEGLDGNIYYKKTIVTATV